MKIAEFPAPAARAGVAAALAEDLATDDITTLWSVPAGLIATAEISTRQPGIAAGLPVVTEVFAQTDPEVHAETLVADGARVQAGDVLVRLTGSARSLITAERTVLNFLQRLCGIATVTDRFVQAVAGTPARILDTRKTAPGLRALDKYAVTVGGGSNRAGRPTRSAGKDGSDRRADAAVVGVIPQNPEISRPYAPGEVPGQRIPGRRPDLAKHS